PQLLRFGVEAILANFEIRVIGLRDFLAIGKKLHIRDLAPISAVRDHAEVMSYAHPVRSTFNDPSVMGGEFKLETGNNRLFFVDHHYRANGCVRDLTSRVLGLSTQHQLPTQHQLRYWHIYFIRQLLSASQNLVIQEKHNVRD